LKAVNIASREGRIHQKNPGENGVFPTHYSFPALYYASFSWGKSRSAATVLNQRDWKNAIPRQAPMRPAKEGCLVPFEPV
jgi:hypothetical protein